MRPMLVALGAVALVATGCATVNPTVGQLEKLKSLAAAGQYQEIVAESVDCDPNKQGCAQAHWIKADACYRLAAGGPPRPPGTSGPGQASVIPAAKRQQLDCAITNYDAALAALASAPDPAVDRNQVELGLLDSLLRRRDLAENSTDADRQNALLEQRAMAAQSGPIGRPAGFYYAADAQLNATLRQTDQGGCAEIARAAEQLDSAQADGTSFGDAAHSLARAIANARTARGCTV